MTSDDIDKFLEDITTCFLEPDYDRWAGIVMLPLSLITQDGTVVHSTPEALRQNFEHYLTAVRIMRLDTISRRMLALQDCGDGTFIVTYETEFLAGGTRVDRPYMSSALLTKKAGRVRLLSILNARGHHHWTGKAPGAPLPQKPQG